MITADGSPKLLEYNCRMGDPETQPIMMRLQSDLVDVLEAAVEGKLQEHAELIWDQRPALGVVMAAGGYPGGYAQGKVISGLPKQLSADVKVFHAETRLENNQIITAGGRVLCVTALGKTLSQARDLAYAQAGEISWDDVYYRRDIGHKAIARNH